MEGYIKWPITCKCMVKKTHIHFIKLIKQCYNLCIKKNFIQLCHES